MQESFYRLTLQEELTRTEREVAQCAAAAGNESLSVSERWGAMQGCCDWESNRACLLDEIAAEQTARKVAA